MGFLVFMYVAAFVLLIAYAHLAGWIRVRKAKWFFVFEVGRALLYVRWLNGKTAESFIELQKKEGL